VRLSRADAATLFDLVERQGMAHSHVMLIGEISVDRAVSVARNGSGRLVTGSGGGETDGCPRFGIEQIFGFAAGASPLRDAV
jgi:hypothetical protein